MTPLGTCRFIPPYLLEEIGRRGGLSAELVEHQRRLDSELRHRRTDAPGHPDHPRRAARARWAVHDAGGRTELPGRPVRRDGQPESGDAGVDEAAVGISATLAMYDEVYGRASFDGEGAEVLLTVHYGRSYANAFWDGTHLVFGDGDGRIFRPFTRAVDVLAHEFAHAVTGHTAGLVYQGQSGALNESVSDVFAACLEQRVLGQSAAEGTWLIGQEIFVEGVSARALRDMAEPGTAYDDPRLGRDPQPRHMDDYVDTTEDNGGVHINSGIPNRAFVLAARAIGALSAGGSAAEGAGRIWYDALTGGSVGPDTAFSAFAAATTAAARRTGGAEHETVVREAWEQVGVTPGSRRTTPPPAPDDRLVRVSRSGGFAGLTVRGALDLDSADPRVPEVQLLVDRIDLTALARGAPQPDRFVYRFELCGDGPVDVPEQDLTRDLSELADLLLSDT
ncbi:protealysin inhibitor emfourin [Nocardioides sp.]|uniref:protealysin inhibitor emfourin n=1 Tax=Nocardioides sp. TaxID=35761 RepID=UPI002ED1E0D1